MNNFDWFLQGLSEAATPMNLLYAVIGVLLGTAVGVLPGIGPAMTVALLLPITYNVSPSDSIGTKVPAAEALLAASGPATPSIAPLPNSSLFFDSRFSVM